MWYNENGRQENNICDIDLYLSTSSLLVRATQKWVALSR